MTGGKKLVSLENTGGIATVTFQCKLTGNSNSATCKRAASWTQNYRSQQGYKSPISTLKDR